MGALGVLAFGANLLCLALLWRRKADDINMRSAWLCSRNDVLANGGVLLAAAGVGVTSAAWPDVTIGLLIAAMFVSTAAGGHPRCAARAASRARSRLVRQR